MKKLRLKTYFNVWKIFGLNALQETLINRGSNILFMVGKILRFSFSLIFLYLIKTTVTSFAGYTSDQMIVFFLTYQFIDLTSQIFYRGVYVFSGKVRSGEFDFLLSKPINPLFRALTGKPDINDAIFMIPSLAVSFYIFSKLDVVVSWQSLLWYLVLLINGLLIVTTINILVLVIGILTTETEGIIWIYRDLSSMGRFPVEIYMQPLKFILYFIIPIGMMITIPTEVLLGINPSFSIVATMLVGVSSFVVSLKLWEWALKKYSGVGS
ncbi:ABC transporter permease [Patescibacteria group bacterium]|nr:ABC transporter permease [Patescibacteria group bacterium]